MNTALHAPSRVHRRSTDPAAALAPARAALEAGQCVGLYPEGAITRLEDQWPARGRTGVVRLALDTGAPVVPLAQWGRTASSARRGPGTARCSRR
ncbi:MAG: acyl-phosphate glycerol 3-phosphate acyltransferase [Frankiales bacterium]|nr:acyl-phosphate glycerol 3-phosphate acyltransferase [Frankiales bacterium]